MATGLDTLMAQVRACTVCAPHLPLGPRPILQAGSKAKVLVVGQAPGRLAHQAGRPFDDPSGDRLRTWLGVDKNSFYDEEKIALVPMGFCYPGTGAGGDMPPRPECAPKWREAVLAQLPDVALTLVIGQYAHDWHLGGAKEKRLTDTVRKWRDFWPSVVPTPHPSPRNIRWLKQNPWFEAEVIPAVQDRVAELIG